MERQSSYEPKFLVSGASGMIGDALVRSWSAERIQVIRLVRQQNLQKATGSVLWDPSATFPVADLGSLEGVGAAVHLSGATVAGPRWTAAYKREIVSSRVQSTLALVNLLTRLKPIPRVLVCASAIGIYGDRGDEVLTEDSALGTGFLAETCLAWEAATKAAEEAGIRVVHARFGVVLSKTGGALAKLLPLFRLGLGGKLADGRAWMPWITLRDTVSVLRYCVQDERIRGPINTVSPNPVTNADFTHALGEALHRPAILPVPAFGLRAAFGEMADQALLASARVTPARLEAVNFPFADPEIHGALRAVLAE